MGSSMVYRLNDPEFLADPAPVLAQMRAEGPLVQVKMPIIGTIWMTTTDAASRTLLKNPDLFRRDPGPITGKPLSRRFWWMPGFFKPLLDTMIVKDDPEHRRMRKLVELAFARATIEDLRPHLTRTADALLDATPTGTVDIVRHYTRPLPFRAICALLGIPEDRHASLARRIAPISAVTNPVLAVFAIFRLRGVLAEFRDLFAEARRSPGPGLISALVHAEEDGSRLTEQQLLSMVMLLFLAGHETTVHLINSAIVALASEPKLRAHFVENPDTRALMIEEFMRHGSPVMTTKMMFAAEDTDILGAPVRKGAQIAPLLLAANHDPARFDAPETFDPERRPNAHLGFGFGPHVCLGMQLARIEAAVALERLFARHPDLQLSEPARYLNRPGLRAPAGVKLML
ncbi:cytochrome P450 [Rhodobacterales bacterium HKCCE4037]|nr:cytochrome P450 [Rhodobacterales bacterium HKCCE4037]